MMLPTRDKYIARSVCRSWRDAATEAIAKQDKLYIVRKQWTDRPADTNELEHNDLLRHMDHLRLWLTKAPYRGKYFIGPVVTRLKELHVHMHFKPFVMHIDPEAQLFWPVQACMTLCQKGDTFLEMYLYPSANTLVHLELPAHLIQFGVRKKMKLKKLQSLYTDTLTPEIIEMLSPENFKRLTVDHLQDVRHYEMLLLNWETLESISIKHRFEFTIHPDLIPAIFPDSCNSLKEIILPDVLDEPQIRQLLKSQRLTNLVLVPLINSDYKFPPLTTRTITTIIHSKVQRFYCQRKAFEVSTAWPNARGGRDRYACLWNEIEVMDLQVWADKYMNSEDHKDATILTFMKP